METKLGTHAYYHDNHLLFKQQQALFFKLLLRYSNLLTHGDETWYACVLHGFHDDNILFEQQQIASVTFVKITSSLLKFVSENTDGDETWYAWKIIVRSIPVQVYYIVTMTTT